MHIGKTIKRKTIQPARIKRAKPLALPEPALIPVPWPSRREQPATIPVRQEVRYDRS